MNKKIIKETLEERCAHKKTAGTLDEFKSYCTKCDGYDKLCPDYSTPYGKRLVRGFEEDI